MWRLLLLYSITRRCFCFLEVCSLLCRHANVYLLLDGLCWHKAAKDLNYVIVFASISLFTILSAMNTVTKRTTHDITHWFCKNKRKQIMNQLFGCAHVCLCNGSPAVTIACWHVQPLTSSIAAHDLRVESGITTKFGGGEWVIGPVRKNI